ncbi:MAG: hypothetical protein PUB35_05055 [Campylobacteraceae bacterium]|nr:hypothetical protein [Campylobacteraceae bacterium]
MSKDKSKKWVISAPLFYNYAKIPYRDPPVKLGDDIVGNSRISRLKFKIPKANSKIPKPCVIPRLDHMISSQRILEFPKVFLRL